MISVGENKAVICKGDFHPAALYKGDKKIAGYTTTEFSGEGGVTLEHCYNDKLHDLKIYGNSVQDGTPTTENPIEVQSEGELVTEGEYAGKYKIPFRARGKNILDMNKHTVSNGYYYDVNGLPFDTNNNLLKISPIAVEPSTTYTISSNVPVYTIWLFKGGDGTSISRIDVNKKIKTFTTTQDCTQIRVSLDLRRMVTDEVQAMSLFQWAMLEKGTGDGIFEPYIEPQTFNIYLDEPLRKIGNYKDYIGFKKDVVVRNVGKTIYTGNENWLTHATKNLLHYAGSKPVYDSNTSDMARSTHLSAQLWANLYQNTSRADGSLMVGVSCVYNESANLRYIYVCPYKTAITVAEWQALLQTWYKEGNPFTVWYGIPTTEYAIDLPELPTFKGTTIYEIDTDVTATISGKYKRTEE